MRKYLIQILIVLVLLGAAWGLYLLGKEPVSSEKQVEASIHQSAGDIILPTHLPISQEFLPIRNWSVENPEIMAKSGIIMSFAPSEVEGNILYQKDKDQVLPIASLSKIMTAIIALENFDLEEVIKVSKDSVLILGDKGGLIRGEELKVRDLLYIMLMESSNDAAMALANDNPRLPYNEFLDLMNSKAKELGLKNTSFLDPIGLNSKNKSTVFELAKLIDYTLRFPVLWEILETPELTIYSIDNQFIHNLINTDQLLGKISFLLGGKTGYTEEAGGCMLTVSEIHNSLGGSNYLITVVLGSDQREIDTETLINWTQEAYLW